MFKRQREGSVVCPSCHLLVGVNDPECFHCGRPNPGMWGFAGPLRRLGNDLGFVPLTIGACSVLYVLTLLADPGGIRAGGMLSLLAPSSPSLFLFGASGAVPVFNYGRFWTLLSAAWLHGGLIHIFFNMMWVRNLAPPTAELYGIGRMVIIYTVSSITGFAASTLWGNALTIGASAPIFGLLGALVLSGKKGSSAVGNQAWGLAVVLFIFGFIFPGVDNLAHAGGFAGGYLVSQWMDPLHPERTDHLILALGCLALSALSIVVSVLHGLRFV